MNKIKVGIIIGVILGLACSLFGVLIYNYKLEKCSVLNSVTNQEFYNYALQDECYIVFQKPRLSLFLDCLVMGFVGVVILGFAGAVLGNIWEDHSW